MYFLRTLLTSLCLAAGSLPAVADNYTVGTEGTCSHANLQAALDAAASTASFSPHVVRVTSGEHLVANVTVTAPQADIVIIGGHATCTAISPTGQTILRKSAVPTSARIFEFSSPASDSTPLRSIHLSNLTLTGGNYTGANGGGAIYVVGKLSVLLGSRVRIEDNQARNGGAIYLFSPGLGGNRTILSIDGGEDPVDTPRIVNNRAVGTGANGDGGGIYSLGNTLINISNGIIQNNEAGHNGGGIAMEAGENALLMMSSATGIPVAIVGNTAGTNGFSDSQGLGGGLYIDKADVLVIYGEPQTAQVAIQGNQANHGGGMYVEGRDGGQADIQFFSSSWLNNIALGKGGAVRANNGVRLVIGHSQVGGWCLTGGVLVRCSQLSSNIARNSGNAGTPGGAGVHVTAQDGLPPGAEPRVHISRTLVRGNLDQDGQAAVAYAGPRTLVGINSSIIVDNVATAPESVLLWAEGSARSNITYNTVLANTSTRMFRIANGQIHLSGSIVWDPGKTLAYLPEGATVSHAGCLLSHTLNQLAPGDDLASVVVANPALDALHRPRGRSPAIDACGADTFPMPDIGMQERDYDVPGVNNASGIADLGAYEQHHIVFYGGFGNKPTN